MSGNVQKYQKMCLDFVCTFSRNKQLELSKNVSRFCMYSAYRNVYKKSIQNLDTLLDISRHLFLEKVQCLPPNSYAFYIGFLDVLGPRYILHGLFIEISRNKCLEMCLDFLYELFQLYHLLQFALFQKPYGGHVIFHCLNFSYYR